MRSIGKICWALGCLLIVASLGLLTFSQLRAHWAANNAARLTQILQELLPPVTTGVTDDYSTSDMPVLQIEGRDFCGLVEIPAYGVTLPVYDSWEPTKTAIFPCRFWGSAYNGSLMIGGADQAGQFDFFDRIDLGAAVTFTDVTGAAFAYTVSAVERYDDIPAAVLMQDGDGLTLFVRDAYQLHYILLRCHFS